MDYNIDIMTIKLSLLSLLSMAYLLMYCGVGDVSLDRLYLDVDVTSSETTINIHPTWAVLVPQDVVLCLGANGMAYGNVMVLGDHLLEERCFIDYVMAHERMHLAQFRALGFAIWPAQFVLDIEPDKSIITNWGDPTQPSATMWQPPRRWPYKWSFITLSWKI